MHSDNVYTLIFVVDISSPFSYCDSHTCHCSADDTRLLFEKRASLFEEVISKAFEKIVSHHAIQRPTACCFKLFDSREKSSLSFYQRTSLYDGGLQAFNAFQSALHNIYTGVEKGWNSHDGLSARAIATAIDEAIFEAHLEDFFDSCIAPEVDEDREKSIDEKERVSMFIMSRTPRTLNDLIGFLGAKEIRSLDVASETLRKSDLVKRISSLVNESRFMCTWVDTLLPGLEQTFETETVERFYECMESMLPSFRFRTLEGMLGDPAAFSLSFLLDPEGQRASKLSVQSKSDCSRIVTTDGETGQVLYILRVVSPSGALDRPVQLISRCVAPTSMLTEYCCIDSHCPGLIVKPADSSSAKVFAALMIELSRSNLVFVMELSKTKEDMAKEGPAGYYLKPFSALTALMVKLERPEDLVGLSNLFTKLTRRKKSGFRRSRAMSPKKTWASEPHIMDAGLLNFDLDQIWRPASPDAHLDEVLHGSSHYPDGGSVLPLLFAQLSKTELALNKHKRDWVGERVARFQDPWMRALRDAVFSGGHENNADVRGVFDSITYPRDLYSVMASESNSLFCRTGAESQSAFKDLIDGGFENSIPSGQLGSLFADIKAPPDEDTGHFGIHKGEQSQVRAGMQASAGRSAEDDETTTSPQHMRPRGNKAENATVPCVSFAQIYSHISPSKFKECMPSNLKKYFQEGIQSIQESVLMLRKENISVYTSLMKSEKLIKKDLMVITKTLLSGDRKAEPVTTTKVELSPDRAGDLLPSICDCLLQCLLRIEYCVRKNLEHDENHRLDPISGRRFKSAKRLLLLVQQVVHSCEHHFSQTDIFVNGLRKFAENVVKRIVSADLPRTAWELYECMDIPESIIAPLNISRGSFMQRRRPAYRYLVREARRNEKSNRVSNAPGSGSLKGLGCEIMESADPQLEPSGPQSCVSNPAGSLGNGMAGATGGKNSLDVNDSKDDGKYRQGRTKRLGSMTEPRIVSLRVSSREQRKSRRDLHFSSKRRKNETASHGELLERKKRLRVGRESHLRLPLLTPNGDLLASACSKAVVLGKREAPDFLRPVANRSRGAKIKAFREGTYKVVETPPP